MADYKIIDAVSSKYVPSWGNAKQFIAIHYLGVTGENHDLASDGTGAHYYIYHDGTIYQRCDHDAIVWQVGTAGVYTQKHATARNANTIGIELCCYCDGDKSSALDPYWYFTEETQNAAVWLVQKLMKELGITADNVLRHWDIVNKVCPAPYYANNGYKTSWTWDEFKAKISGESGETQWYRVRLSWDNADSQLGAYLDKNNAIAACLPGYSVYDWEGKAVYTNEATGTQATMFKGLSEADAAAKILEVCAPIAIAYWLFPSVCAAQTILESGYCTTELAQSANNVCGMKCTLSGNTWSGSTWDGTSKVSIKTAEQDSSGNEYYIYADFRKYPCIEDSIKDRCAYLLGAMNGSSLRYKGITDCADYKAQIQLIKDGGYATDVSYVSKICNIIERFNLTVYDSQVTPSTAQPESGSGWYRVRMSWENAESQIGAFAVLDNAKACADANVGYSVYDESGTAVYSPTMYYVQAGAFAVEKNADKRVSDLKKDGFDVYLKYDEGDKMFHCQCGVFSEKKNAESLVSKLKAAGYDAIIK